MWTDTPEGRKYIDEISKLVVGEVALEELDLFDELCEEYHTNPMPLETSTSGSDDPLAFGVEGVFIALTPIIMATTTSVVEYLLGQAADSVKQEGSARIKQWIKRAINPENSEKKPNQSEENQRREQEKAIKTETKEKTTPSVLTKEQLKMVRKIARRQAESYGLDSELANKMADALIGKLALAA